APPSHTPGMLGRRALPGGRIAALGATMDLHHGLLALMLPFGFAVLLGARPSNAEWTPGQCGSRVGVERGCIARRMPLDFRHGPLAQIDPRTALIERGAWSALRAGQAHAAAEAFREAIAADPKNPRLHLGAGMAASL